MNLQAAEKELESRSPKVTLYELAIEWGVLLVIGLLLVWVFG